MATDSATLIGAGSGGGGLHLRRPPDIFANAAARNTYFTDAANGAARLQQFITDRSLAIILGSAANPTFQTYIGDSTHAAADWAPRTDAVQGPAGAAGARGEPGPSFTVSAVTALETVVQSNDRILFQDVSDSNGNKVITARQLAESFVRIVAVVDPTTALAANDAFTIRDDSDGGARGVRASVVASYVLGVLSLTNLPQGGASDGQALVWSSSNSRWQPGTVAAGDSDSGGGITSVEPTDLDGIDAAPTARHLVRIGADTDEFDTLDPAALDPYTLAEVVDKLGLPAQAAANRMHVLVRKADETGFTYLSQSALIGVQPSITTFDVSGPERVAPGTDLNDETYRYTLRLGQTGHVEAARIVGFRGTAQTPNNPTVLIAATDFTGNHDHASGEISIPDNTALANAGDIYTIRAEVYEDGQTPGTDAPVAYQDFRIQAQAVTMQTHFGAIAAAEDAGDIAFADDDIAARHGAAGQWTVSGIGAGMHRLYWAVPSSDLQPVRWTQDGFNITATIDDAVTRSLGAPSVEYRFYLFAAANAVGSDYNGTVIEVST